MRKITPGGTPHKRHLDRALVPAFLMLCLAAGCRQPPPPPSPAPADSAASTVTVPEGGGVDVSAVTAWEQLARRLVEGDRPSLTEFQQLYHLPGQAHAYAPGNPGILTPLALRQCTEEVFLASRPDSRRAKRRDVVANLAYLKPRLARLDSFLAALRAQRLDRRILRTLSPWVPADSLPGGLTVRLFVGTTSLRYDSATRELMVDAGLALASGADQLTRMAAAFLYRYFAPLVGPDPARAADGRVALASALDMLHREAIAAWIEQYPHLVFPPDHPRLGGKNARRHDTVSRGAAALTHLAGLVPAALADSSGRRRTGYAVERYLRFAHRYAEVGYAMAALVADRLGEATLRRVAADPLAFLDAYQRAAADADAAPGQLALLSPLPDAVVRGWEEHFRRTFPDTGRNTTP